LAEPLRLVFAGTPDFALPALRALLAGPHPLLAVYTQPDRPAGRGRRLRPSPVKEAALAAGIEVREPETLRAPEAVAALAALAPDLMVVVAYGLILPPSILAVPRFGCWNLHASLLPRWRGAAPVARAIEAGDAETGVCLMQMDQGLDTGPVLACRPAPILPEDTTETLEARLAVLGAELLSERLAELAAGRPPLPAPQPAAGVTYARKLSKDEALLDPRLPAELLARRVRAFQPWPVAEIVLAGERVRVFAALALPDPPRPGEPGEILAAGPQGIDIACSPGVLRLLRVQRPGGRVLDTAAYLHGRPGLRR
jgi:methionyl-tRNA formyltransferase